MKTLVKQTGKKTSKKKLLLLGLGLLTTGVLSYFGIQYFKKNKEENPASEESTSDFSAKKATTTAKTNPKTTAKANSKTNSKTQPKTGTNPTSKAGTNSTQSKTQTKQEKVFNPALIAQSLHTLIRKKDFSKVFDQLKIIKSAKQYSAVSKVFSTYFLNRVRQTLVNGLLNTFNSEKQKQSLKKAFTAMGLKYNGKQWSLSGTEQGVLLITTQDTKVWKNPKTPVPVPMNMVLGSEVAKRGNYTLFENEQQYFLVQSDHINYFKQ